jgi:hypothetical protein
MAFIDTVPIDQAAGDVKAMYAQSERDLGYVPNFCKVFSHRPEVMSAWRGLLGSIRPSLDPRRYELVTLAAARRFAELLLHARARRRAPQAVLLGRPS